MAVVGITKSLVILTPVDLRQVYQDSWLHSTGEKSAGHTGSRDWITLMLLTQLNY